MKKVLLMLFSLAVFNANAHEPEYSDRTDIIHILESYSERTGVKFVADARVKARVNMIGIKLEDLDQTDINKILFLHSFVAYEKSDIVYVIPQAIEKEFGQQMGTKWHAQ